jgi:predicted RNase H-like HicB family nuclease
VRSSDGARRALVCGSGPTLVGCVATGRTIEETVANMREALAFVEVA